MAVPPGAAQRGPGPAAPGAPQPRRELPRKGSGEARILPAATRSAGGMGEAGGGIKNNGNKKSPVARKEEKNRKTLSLLPGRGLSPPP